MLNFKGGNALKYINQLTELESKGFKMSSGLIYWPLFEAVNMAEVTPDEVVTTGKASRTTIINHIVSVLTAFDELKDGQTRS